jgi:hypothetical protein
LSAIGWRAGARPPDVWDRQDAVETACKHLEEARAQMAQLAQQIQATQRQRTAAQARRTEQERQHWATVRSRLTEPFEICCCQLLAQPAGFPPSPPADLLQRLGPMGVSQLLVETCQRLREHFPVVEEEPVYG